MDNYLTNNIIEIFRPLSFQNYSQDFGDQQQFKDYLSKTNLKGNLFNSTPYLFKYTIENYFFFSDLKSFEIQETLFKTNRIVVNLVEYNGKPAHFIKFNLTHQDYNQLLIQNILSNFIHPCKYQIFKTFVVDNQKIIGYICDLPKGNFLINIVRNLSFKDRVIIAENIFKNLRNLISLENFDICFDLETIFVLESSYKEYTRENIDEIIIYLNKNISPAHEKSYINPDFRDKKINQIQLIIVNSLNILFNPNYEIESNKQSIDQDETWKISNFFMNDNIKQDFQTRFAICLSYLLMKNNSLKSVKKIINKLRKLFKEIYSSLNLSETSNKNDDKNHFNTFESSEIIANISADNLINFQFNNTTEFKKKDLDQIIDSLVGTSTMKNKNSLFSIELQRSDNYQNELFNKKQVINSLPNEYKNGNFSNYSSQGVYFSIKIKKEAYQKMFSNLEIINEHFLFYNSNQSPLKISFNLSLPYNNMFLKEKVIFQTTIENSFSILNKTHLNKANFNSKYYFSNLSEDYEVSEETVFEGFKLDKYQITIQERISIIRNTISLIANENLSRFSLYNSSNISSYIDLKNNVNLNSFSELSTLNVKNSFTIKQPINITFNLKFDKNECACREKENKIMQDLLEIKNDQNFQILMPKSIVLNNYNISNLFLLQNSYFSKNLQITTINITIESSNRILKEIKLDNAKEDKLFEKASIIHNHKSHQDETINRVHTSKLLDEQNEENFSIIGIKLPLIVSFNLKTEQISNNIISKNNYLEISNPSILEIVNNILIDFDPKMAIYYTLQGDTNYESGQYEESLFFYLKSLDINIYNFSSPNKDLAISYNNCASAYLKLKDYQNSLEFYQKALNLYEEIYGKEHLIIASVWNNMGLIFESIADYKNSLSCYIKSLKIKKQLLESKNPTIALGYYNIAKSYELLNSFEKAEKFYIKSISIFKSNEPCLDYATVLLSLGLLNDKLGKLKEAVELYDECIWISQSLSIENILSATAYNNLGLVLIKAEQYDEAIRNFNLAIKIRTKLQGKLNFESASIFNNLACAYFKKEDFDQALVNYISFVDIFIELNKGSKLNCETATAYNNIGLVHVKRKEYEQASELFSYAVNIKKQINVEIENETISFMNNLAGVYFKLKQFSNSLSVYLDIYNYTSSSSLTFEDENLNAIKNIGHCYLNLYDFNSAISNYEKGLEMSIAQYGENSLKSAECYFNLGLAFDNLNQNENSLKMFKKCYEIRRTILGEEDQSVNLVYTIIQKLENTEEN